MATFTHQDVVNFYADHEGDIRVVLNGLETVVIEGRDKREIPIYLTKQRVKSVNSLYLKTKRKTYASLDEVTDIAGLRILCLFEQDIFDVHQYLVGLLKHRHYMLTEFKIYGSMYLLKA